MIGNGVETKFFTPKESDGDSQYIFFSGRLIVEKGLLDLVKCAEYVCKAHPSICFVLAGSGPLENSLRKLIEKKRLQSNFSLVGNVGRNDILKYYQNSRIFVLPSIYESFPNTLLEAMACGLPVVTTRVCDAPRIVKDGENGLLVPPRNPFSLAQALLRLLEDETLRKKMGKACRKRVENLYSLDSLCERILECYDSLV